ncbi:type II toxin-antitoxin system VapC family toxin [Serinicoccus kebangsaanensis]|uniref:type II toxin-antitoxin system VapC family toxin n=1 Tax=Serinicoccus kebangsaanensis TaxID=2602069 RepID=UPI00124C0214|nr:type II toxin-antitoxin system VapC family toxin [Serinicoccus kebangsaanensis]
MTGYFVDTAVFAYAVGAPHPHRDGCRSFLRSAARHRIPLHASSEAVQEFLFHRLRRGGRAAAVAQTRAMMDGLVLHPVDQQVLDRCLELVTTTPLRGRDAVHAATALLAGFDEIVTTDADFAGCGLRVVPPARA